jgi:cellulose synthase/poly-beta-1,6-N-acetylglucosamine synthase-like glycosyltransferase
MTWWGALGLALSLYGVVVLLEWLYDQLLRSRGNAPAPLSVVLRAPRQEAQIERAVRELARLLEQARWPQRRFEVLIVDAGPEDHTRDIVERFSRHYPYLRLVDPELDADEILAQCQYPVIVWLDLTRSENERILNRLSRLLHNFGSL